MTEQVMSKGYWQAVDNLAWEIRRLSSESQRPFMEENPELYDDPKKAIEFCAEHMTDEQTKQWEALENIYTVIMETYNIDFDTLYPHVFARMFQYDIEAGEFDL